MEDTLTRKESITANLYGNGILQEACRDEQEQKSKAVLCNDIRPPNQFSAALGKGHPDDSRSQGCPPAGKPGYRFAFEGRELISRRCFCTVKSP